MTFIAGAVAVAAASVSFQPQDDALDPANIIVPGERVPRRLKDTPSSVVVMTKRDFGSMAAPDRLQDLLSSFPNILFTGRLRHLRYTRHRDAPVGVTCSCGGFVVIARVADYKPSRRRPEPFDLRAITTNAVLMFSAMG